MTANFKIVAAAVLILAAGTQGSAANAAVTVFDVSGAFHNGSLLSGTVSIDTAAGVSSPVTALNLTVTTGVNQFAGFSTSMLLSDAPFGQGYFQIEAGSFSAPYIKLFLHTGSLVGYTGGPLCSDFNIAPAYCGFASVAYAANGAYSAIASGGLTPSIVQAAVPEPAAWAMMVAGFGLLGWTVRRRQKVTASVTFA